jgi:hypothetical protein
MSNPPKAEGKERRERNGRKEPHREEGRGKGT